MENGTPDEGEGKRGKERRRKRGGKEKGGRCYWRAGGGPPRLLEGCGGLCSSVSLDRTFNRERGGEGGYRRVGTAVERLLRHHWMATVKQGRSSLFHARRTAGSVYVARRLVEGFSAASPPGSSPFLSLPPLSPPLTNDAEPRWHRAPTTLRWPLMASSPPPPPLPSLSLFLSNSSLRLFVGSHRFGPVQAMPTHAIG